MAKRDFEQLVFQVRLGSKQKALQQALLIPWRRLLEAASAYAEWHIFVLWVRAIAEFEEQLPDIVRAALGSRCPGFLEDEVPRRQGYLHDQSFLWHSLEEWIVVHYFAEAKSQGWFDAVMFYAYKDPRTEQAWSLWERTKEAWHRERPSRWPSFEEWRAQVIATHALTESGSDKAARGEVLLANWREGSSPCRSRQPPPGDGPPNCGADHFSRATRPATVFPGLFDRDRQVVSALVMPLGGARWAASHPVPAGLPLHLDMVQNPELARL